MYLADYHTHTCCSFDGESPLAQECAQAAALGFKALCTTDHCDLIGEKGGRVFSMDWAPILNQFAQCQTDVGALKLRLGLELGSAYADPDCARAILAGAPLDFVIGSVHNQSLALGGVDYYFLEYPDLAFCHQALDDYFDSLLAMAQLSDCYDVLGHIIYPLRYMTGVPGGVTLDAHQEQLRAIFTTAAQAGRGIEVNTYRGRILEDWRPVLQLYRACGGEIVTIGSDAHRADDIGKGVIQAQQLLKEVGFRYQAIYQQRTAQFVRL